MYAKLPIITFNKDGRKEQIRNSFNGYLVENEIEMLEKTQQLIKSKRLRDVMGKNSYKIVTEKFDVIKFANKLDIELEMIK